MVDMLPWEPLRELGRLHTMMDRLLAGTFATLGHQLGGLNAHFPVEVLEQNGEVVVRAELAGIEPKTLDVRVTDEDLTVRGERRVEVDRDQAGIHHSERFYGAFVRTVPFPAPVDAGQATASFRNGLLEVRAPRRTPDAGTDGRRLDIDAN